MEIKLPPYKKPSRLKSWITLEQIEKEEEGRIFLNKIGDILFTDKYRENAVKYARSILDFLVDWDYITWKQYDSLMAITKDGEWSPTVMTRNKNKAREGYYYVNTAKDYINVKSKSLSFTVTANAISSDSLLGSQIRHAKTDKDFDDVYKKIFGERPRFEEEMDGETVCYRRDGSRYFAWPTGEENLWDYI